MTLYDRQTLKAAAILAVRRRVDPARRTLESMSVQGRHTPEYEDICSALEMLEQRPPDKVPGSHATDCAREALGCWWTCAREKRQHCSLAVKVFGFDVAA